MLELLDKSPTAFVHSAATCAPSDLCETAASQGEGAPTPQPTPAKAFGKVMWML